MSDWPSPERRAVCAAALGLFGTFLVTATQSTVVYPVQQTFAAGPEGELLLRQLPDLAGLVAVPLIGAIGARVSSARMAAIAAACIGAGASLLSLAPTMAVFVLGMVLGSVGRMIISVVAFAVVGAGVAHEGGEANLIVPDLSTVEFRGVNGRSLLMLGLVVCAAGLLFGLMTFNELKNMPVHPSMREVSELIYET